MLANKSILTTTGRGGDGGVVNWRRSEGVKRRGRDDAERRHEWAGSSRVGRVVTSGQGRHAVKDTGPTLMPTRAGSVGTI